MRISEGENVSAALPVNDAVGLFRKVSSGRRLVWGAGKNESTGSTMIISKPNVFTRVVSGGILTLAVAIAARAQSVALLYDLRHTTDSANNPRNFTEVEFKYFKALSFGPFLMKEEIDLNGANDNASKIYTQLSQGIALGSTSVNLHLGYSGGLGLFDNATGGYYLQNCYELGLEHPFSWGTAFGNAYAALRYTNAQRPSYDPMLVVYLGRFFSNYKILGSVDLEVWTTNRNLGDPWNSNLSGKTVSCLIEAEFWVKIRGKLSAGTLTRITYNVYANSNRWLVYPTIGLKYDF